MYNLETNTLIKVNATTQNKLEERGTPYHIDRHVFPQRKARVEQNVVGSRRLGSGVVYTEGS
jgi:hypothetical protein